ncbi:MAG: orotidine-5'-phosphate decarboxylase [Deltaproteobacteria bacterium]
MQRIDARQRIIVALDVFSVEEARGLIDRLEGVVSFFKINFLLILGGADRKFREELANRGKQIFIDLKFNDIDSTVESYIRRLAEERISFCTINAAPQTVKAALAGKAGNPDFKLLQVTVLTGMGDYNLRDLYGINCSVPLETVVLHRAKAAYALGCDGVVASAHEAKKIKALSDGKLIVVTPGIRPDDNTDDHRRAATPEFAIAQGADYLVVGRPIIKAADPVRAALGIIERMQRAFDAR